MSVNIRRWPVTGWRPTMTAWQILQDSRMETIWLYPLTRTRGKSPKLEPSWEDWYKVITWIMWSTRSSDIPGRGWWWCIWTDMSYLGAAQDEQPYGGSSVMCATVMSVESEELLPSSAHKEELLPPHHRLKLWQAVHMHIENFSGFWMGVDRAGSGWKGLAAGRTLANNY
jgi:hypothetical protein